MISLKISRGASSADVMPLSPALATWTGDFPPSASFAAAAHASPSDPSSRRATPRSRSARTRALRRNLSCRSASRAPSSLRSSSRRRASVAASGIPMRSMSARRSDRILLLMSVSSIVRRPNPISSKCTAWAGEDSLPGSSGPNHLSNEKPAISADKVLQFAAIISIYPIGYVVRCDWTRPYEER